MASKKRFYRELRDGDGKIIRIYVDVPHQVGPRGDMECEYGIETEKKTFTGRTPGIDGIQAIYLALQSLHSRLDLINSERTPAARIRWSGGMNEDDLGLPSHCEP